MPSDLRKLNKTEIILDPFTQEDWIELWNFLNHKPDLVKADSKIAQALTNYETLFFSNLDKVLNEETAFCNLETFHILHKRKSHILSQDRFRILVNSMVAILKKSDLHKAYKLAINCREDDLCQTVIRDFESKLPKRVLII